MFYKPNNNIIYFTFINDNSKYKFKRFHGSLKTPEIDNEICSVLKFYGILTIKTCH